MTTVAAIHDIEFGPSNSRAMLKSGERTDKMGDSDIRDLISIGAIRIIDGDVSAKPRKRGR